jgi:hypothetical protein
MPKWHKISYKASKKGDATNRGAYHAPHIIKLGPGDTFTFTKNGKSLDGESLYGVSVVFGSGVGPRYTENPDGSITVMGAALEDQMGVDHHS